ncbi:MAG: porin, partial [Pseudomonadota bacterium]|nr:porin [Pseudomonadota bacterium]
FILAADNTGAERKSYGGYGQLAAKLGATKIGVSYGTSRLSETDADRAALGGVLLKNNESYVVGVYHALTKSLNLVAEYIRTNSENHIGSEIEEDAIAVGAILFF